MGKSTEITCQISQFAAIFLLIIGYGMANIWLGFILSLVMILFWSIPRRFITKWLSSAKLVGYVGIAAGGLLYGVSPYLTIAGVTAALTCWELEDQRPNSSKFPNTSFVSSCEQHHLKKLGIAITTGLIVGEAGLFLKLSLPFGAAFLVAILILFCIFQLFLLFKRT